MAVVAFALGSAWFALAVLTGLGAHRRGLAGLPAALAGLLFPLTWTVWYLRDERPYRRSRRHVA